MRRYSPIIILLVAIGCTFTLSKVYQPQLDVQQKQQKSNSLNKDIALSSIKESFSNFLRFDVSLKKVKKEHQIVNSNSIKETKTTFDTINTNNTLDTIKDMTSSPILMLDDLVKKNF